MKAPEKPTRLHKPKFENASGALIRYCENCGATWKLGPAAAGHQTLAWRPIAELDTEGNFVDGVVIDVLYCPVEAEAPKQNQKGGLAAVDAAAQKPELCYCAGCQGRKPHFHKATACYCNSCNGNRKHYG